MTKDILYESFFLGSSTKVKGTKATGGRMATKEEMDKACPKLKNTTGFIDVMKRLAKR